MVRLATHDHVPALVALGALMHAESLYRTLTWAPEKVAANFHQWIDDPQRFFAVAERGGDIIGMGIGCIDRPYFSDDLVAADILTYVHPERRGGMAGVRLITAYTDWALARGARLTTIGITTGITVEMSSRLFRTLGYEPMGLVFQLGEVHV